MKSTRTLWIVLVCAMGVAVWIVAENRRATRKPAAPTQSQHNLPAASTNATKRTTTVAIDPAGGGDSGAFGEDTEMSLSADRLRQIISDFEKSSQYPSWSRPHDKGSAYKLTWNQPANNETPFEVEGREPSGDLSFRYTADRLFVNPGEALTTSIEVVRGNTGQRVPIQLSDGALEAIDRGGVEILGALHYNDDGRDGDKGAGDNQWTHRFIPSAIAVLREMRTVRLAVNVEVLGKRARVYKTFTYAPSRVVVIREASDAVDQGSLSVVLNVTAERRGLYTFEANLLTANEQIPVSYVHTAISLEAGANLVPLRFFGKAFHDRNLPGPYVVADFRGELRPTGGHSIATPWSDATRHVTKAYAVADFSPADWSSPAKQERIDRLNALLDQAEAGQGPPSKRKPRHIHVDQSGAHIIE